MKPRLGPGILPAEGSARMGVSLMELLIALAIAGVIAVGLFTFFGATSQTYSDQAATARMLQNATTAMTMITKDIRMAGTIWSMPCALEPLVSASNAGGGTITIRVVLDDPAVRTELVPPGQFQDRPGMGGVAGVQVLSTTGFAVNDTAFITDGVQCTRFTVTGLVPAGAVGPSPWLVHMPGADLNSPGGAGYMYPAASSLVYRRATNQVITYAIDASDPTARWLTRDTGAGPVRVVPDIESLRLFYRDNAGNTINDPSTIDTAAEAASIRLVNVTVNSRTERPSRVMGGDGFRRHALVSSIQLRNLRQ